jgi:hypothetical protein
MKTMFCAKTSQKPSGKAILVSDKIDLKSKTVKIDKKAII